MTRTQLEQTLSAQHAASLREQAKRCDAVLRAMALERQARAIEGRQ